MDKNNLTIIELLNKNTHIKNSANEIDIKNRDNEIDIKNSANEIDIKNTHSLNLDEIDINTNINITNDISINNKNNINLNEIDINFKCVSDIVYPTDTTYPIDTIDTIDTTDTIDTIDPIGQIPDNTDYEYMFELNLTNKNKPKNRFDDEIKSLLDDVKITQYDTFDIINKKIDDSIDKIYGIFSNYEKNELNKDDTKKILNNVEIIDFDDIKRDDIITCFNLKMFFDLKLFDKFKVKNVSKTNKIIKGLTFTNDLIVISFKSKNVYYREIDDEKMLKLKLLDYL